MAICESCAITIYGSVEGLGETNSLAGMLCDICGYHFGIGEGCYIDR